MREDKFYELIGEIDPEIIAAADKPVPFRQKRGFKIALIAAVLAFALLLTSVASAFALAVGYFVLRDDVNDGSEPQDPVQDDAQGGKPGGLVGELFGGIDWGAVKESISADGNINWGNFFAALQGKDSHQQPESAVVFESVRLDDGTMKITGFTAIGTATEIHVPETLSGSKVTVIGEWAFAKNTDITYVSLPNSVTVIENNAFHSCTNLETVKFPDALVEIGDYAFAACNSLSNCDLPETLKTLGSFAFMNCSSITGVIIPSSLRNWGDHSFYCCLGLQNLEIREGVTSIPAESFRGAKIQEVTIPRSVTYIEDFAFTYCEDLQSVILGEELKSIGRDAFAMTAIKQLNVPSTVTTIGDVLFSGCENLETVIFAGDAPEVLYFESPTGLKPNTMYSIYYLLGATGFAEPEWYGHSCVLLQCITQPYVSESGLATIPFYRETVLGTTGTSYFSEDVIVISNQVQRKKYEKILSGFDHNYELEADYFENYSIVLIKVMHSGSEAIIGVAGLGHIDTSLYPVVIVDSPELITDDIQYTYIAVEIAGTDRYYSDAEIFAYNLNPERLGQGSAHHDALPAFTIPE